MPLPSGLQIRGHSNGRFAIISSMQHLQPQYLLEWIKVPIAVQQLIPSQQTERSDPAVDGLADGISTFTQGAVVRCRGNTVFSAACLKYVECEKLIAYLLKLASFTNALQHFAEDHVGKTQSLERHFAVEPLRFGVEDASYIVNPDSRVYDNHPNYSVLRPRRDSSRFPSHFTLPRNRRIPACERVWMSRRSAVSTVAFFVSAPPSRMACRIKVSSMSILVRIRHPPNV